MADFLEDEITDILNLDIEDDEGSIEYKRSLLSKDENRLEELATQMRYRIEEGKGECRYIIGADDDGSLYGLNDDEYAETIEVLTKVSEKNDYSIRLLQTTDYKGKKVSEFLVRENNIIGYSEIRVAIAGNVDSGKCEGKDTKILMYSGAIKNIQDIVVGDVLMGDDSTPRKVLNTTNGVSSLYEITPVNGDPLYVTENHVLCLKASNYNYTYWNSGRKRYGVRYFSSENGTLKHFSKNFNTSKYSSKEETLAEAELFLSNILLDKNTIKCGDVVEISCKDFIKLNGRVKSSLKLYRTPIEYSYQDVILDPYMLGYWLGDGVSVSSRIVTADLEVVEYYRDVLVGYDMKITHEVRYCYYIGYKYKPYKGCNFFLNCLRKYDLIGNKHIPDVYKYNSRSVRMGVLAGLIDSDGYYTGRNGYDFTFTAKNRKLCNDIVELIRSLGFSCYPKDRIKICTNSSRGRVRCECVSFSLYGEGIEEIPVLLERKKSGPRVSKKNVLVTGIKSIKEIPDQEYYGFELDGNGRYLHSDFLVTHNSSSIGTLITGRQDDGRGSARTYVLKYDHELKTGRTSSVSQQIIGYDPEGKVVNHDSEVKNITWPDIVKRSSKIITFFDLCGHTKYAKTTISGIVSSSVDYAVVTVGANMGARGNTLEHIRICLTFKIPVIILLTKMDLVKDKPDMLKENLANIKRLFNAPGSRKKCMLIKEIGDVLNIVDHIKTGSIVPIFKISNIDLSGHDLVHEFFNLLQPRIQFEKEGPVEYHIDTTFTVHGIGTVLGGMLKKGRVAFGKEYYVGPFRDNSYKKAKVRSIHVKRTLVSEVDSGRYVCLATPKLERDSIERGMVLLESPGPSIREFKAEVIVFKTHHTTIKVGYRTTMNVNSLRTTIELMSILTKKKTSLKMSSEQVKEGSESPGVLRLGDRAMIVIKSLFRPVYVSVGDRFSMSEGKVKVTGIVREIL